MDKALGYLGLAVRAGSVAVGWTECAKAMGRRKGALLVTASDAGENTIHRAENLVRGRGTLLRTGYSKQELAGAIGSSSPVALLLIGNTGLAAAFAAAAAEQGKQEEEI